MKLRKRRLQSRQIRAAGEGKINPHVVRQVIGRLPVLIIHDNIHVPLAGALAIVEISQLARRVGAIVIGDINRGIVRPGACALNKRPPVGQRVAVAAHDFDQRIHQRRNRQRRGLIVVVDP